MRAATRSSPTAWRRICRVEQAHAQTETTLREEAAMTIGLTRLTLNRAPAWSPDDSAFMGSVAVRLTTVECSREARCSHPMARRSNFRRIRGDGRSALDPQRI